MVHGVHGSQIRSLPEHTVDCWVAFAVIARYPEALLWAPTQRDAYNWDMAFRELGAGKCLIFENKGTFGGYKDPYRHVIKIDVHQLARYVEAVSAPVYYVLPNPPWKSTVATWQIDPTAPVAMPARCRTGNHCSRSDHPPHGPFETWVSVIEALDLLRVVRDRMARQQKTIDIPGRLVQRHPRAVTLQAFLDGLRTCEQGGPRHDNAAAARRHWQNARRQAIGEVSDLIGELHDQREMAAGEGVRTGVLAAFVPIPRPRQP